MRRAASSDRTAIVDILVRAFDNNKSVNFVVRQDKQRIPRIRKLMEYSYNLCLGFGEVWVSENGDACALVLFPDRKCSNLRTLLWDIKLALEVIGISRIGEVLKREAMIKAQHPKTPIAYLWFVGVSPEQQGKGIGSTFMLDVIQECQRRERPVYLETSMEQNLSFYEKLGFEVFHTVQLSYTIYQLRRTS